MRNRLPKAFMAVLLIVLLVGSLAQAAEKTMSIDLKDSTLRQALVTVFEKAKVNYVIKAGVVGDIDSMALRDVTLNEALKILAKAGNVTYTFEDNVYIVEPKQLVVGATPPVTDNTALQPGETPEQTVMPDQQSLESSDQLTNQDYAYLDQLIDPFSPQYFPPDKWTRPMTQRGARAGIWSGPEPMPTMVIPGGPRGPILTRPRVWVNGVPVYGR